MINIEELLKPGINHLLIRHDADCPGSSGQPDGCICQPDIEVARDAAHFNAVMTKNRAARRKAEREAARAMRKAAKKTGGAA